METGRHDGSLVGSELGVIAGGRPTSERRDRVPQPDNARLASRAGARRRAIIVTPSRLSVARHERHRSGLDPNPPGAYDLGQDDRARSGIQHPDAVAEPAGLPGPVPARSMSGPGCRVRSSRSILSVATGGRSRSASSSGCPGETGWRSASPIAWAGCRATSGFSPALRTRPGRRSEASTMLPAGSRVVATGSSIISTRAPGDAERNRLHSLPEYGEVRR